MVKYLDNNNGRYSFYQKPAPLSGQTATGYGNRIPCNQMVIDLQTKRHYRVYAICYSNCASLYVTIKGERFFIR